MTQDERVEAYRSAYKIYKKKRLAWMEARQNSIVHKNAPNYLVAYKKAKGELDDVNACLERLKKDCDHTYKGNHIFQPYDSSPDWFHCEVCKVAWNAVSVSAFESKLKESSP